MTTPVLDRRASNCIMFAIKAEVGDPRAREFAFADQKTMYGGNASPPATSSSYSPARTRVARGWLHRVS